MGNDTAPENKNSLKLGWGAASLQASGPLTTIVILFLALALVNSGVVLYHHWGIGELHTAMIDGLKDLTEAQRETTYLSTLTEQERQALCLDMPSSLKSKIQRNGGAHPSRRC